MKFFPPLLHDLTLPLSRYRPARGPTPLVAAVHQLVLRDSPPPLSGS